MLSIALSLYFSTIPQSRPKLTFYPLAILHQILNNSVNEYQRAILTKFSDLGNVCNKPSMSLTNCYRYCTVKGPKCIADIFLCRPLKMATKRIVQLMLLYTRLISTKRLHKYADILVKYYSYSNRVENIALSEICKHTSKTGNLSYIKLKRFARLLQVSQHFAYVIRYQVLYNITYVATYLTLTILYRT